MCQILIVPSLEQVRKKVISSVDWFGRILISLMELEWFKNDFLTFTFEIDFKSQMKNVLSLYTE